MFKPIEQVQRQYTTAVPPVQFFETRNNPFNQKTKNPFNLDGFTDSSKKYHLYHPDVSHSEKGGKLDLMG